MAQNIGSVIPGLGAALGTGLAQPINERLDLLAQDKLMQLQEAAQSRQNQREQSQLTNALTSLGVPSELAPGLAALSPQERFSALKSLQGGELPGTEGKMSLSDLFTTPAEREKVAASKRAAERLKFQEKSAENVQNRFEAGQEFKERQAQRTENKFEKTQSLKEKQVEKAENLAAHKETAKLRQDIINKSRGAKETLARLGRMKELVNKGDLGSNLRNQFVKSFGFDWDLLKTADAQEMQKLIADSLSNIKTVFGSRPTNFDVQAYLKKLPSLLQSKEGQQRVIRDLEILSQAALIDDEAMNEVRKKNKGKWPLDLLEKIEEKVGPKLDVLYKEFIQGTQLNQRRKNKKTGEEQKWNGQSWVPA